MILELGQNGHPDSKRTCHRPGDNSLVCSISHDTAQSIPQGCSPLGTLHFRKNVEKLTLPKGAVLRLRLMVFAYVIISCDVSPFKSGWGGPQASKFVCDLLKKKLA